MHCNFIIDIGVKFVFCLQNHEFMNFEGVFIQLYVIKNMDA